MNLSQKRVLITGATGFIGGELARRLQLQEGARVRALARTPAKAQPLAEIGVEVVQGDITDPDSVRRAMSGCDVVYHAAAYVDEQGHREAVWRVNVEGTRHMVEAASEAGVERFVHLSSCAVYGSPQRMNIDETAPIRMTGRVYHDSKVAAEEVAFEAHRRHGLPLVVARPSQVYGLGSPQFTLRVIEAIKAGKVILIDDGRHYFKPAYIENLVDGLVACAKVDAAVGEAFNLTDGFVVTWREFFLAYGKMMGVTHFSSVPYRVAWLMALINEAKAKIRGRPTSLNREVVKTFRSHNSFSNEKAKRLLGWSPAVDFQEGMRRTETWLRERDLI
ncbi:MAG: SDR family NAD(P)-dependent oxidoreductase [Chloroflexi bacterium]|nr:SDR family NAD(P)-dependent oxidoreductase [Chloroflexota bacterium]